MQLNMCLGFQYEFQFQYGLIKAKQNYLQNSFYSLFQFQYGLIKAYYKE